MPPPFKIVTADEFEAMVEAFDWRRKVTDVHVHHTADKRATFTGDNHVGLMNSTYRAHMGRGFSDIGIHAIVFPDGQIGIGRDWNADPASIKGHNRGAFAFEVYGDLRDPPEGDGPMPDDQKWAHAQAIHAVQKKHGLDRARFTLHKERSATACPGALTRGDVLAPLALFDAIPNWRLEQREGKAVEVWNGGARRADLKDSRTLADARKGQMESLVGLFGTAGTFAAGLTGAPWYVQAPLAAVAAFALGVAVWRFLLVRRYRVEDHEEGER